MKVVKVENPTWRLGEVRVGLPFRPLTELDIQFMSEESGSSRIGVCSDRCCFRVGLEPEAFAWFDNTLANKKSCPRCGQLMTYVSRRVWAGTIYLLEYYDIKYPKKTVQDLKAEPIHYLPAHSNNIDSYLTACKRDVAQMGLNHTSNIGDITCGLCKYRLGMKPTKYIKKGRARDISR